MSDLSVKSTRRNFQEILITDRTTRPTPPALWAHLIEISIKFYSEPSLLQKELFG
jgi:hypothetical protein